MGLIPIMKKVDIEKFELEKKVGFSIPENVSIEFPLEKVKDIDKDLEVSDYEEGDIVQYECNKYDVTYIDEEHGVQLWLYVYVDEHRDKIFAIDEVVKPDDEEIFYPTKETPFAKIFGI